MSSVISGRKSFGSRSNKSVSSKRAPKVSSRFWKPTISSILKKRELGLIKEDEENENLTESGKTTRSIPSGKSPKARKMIYKSPAKSVSRLSNKFPSPAGKPRVPKAPRRINKIHRKPISNNKENRFSPRPMKRNILKRMTPKKPTRESKIIKPKPTPEEIDFKFEIPGSLSKKRDQKAADKIEEAKEVNQEDNKEISDITNINLETISNSTPMR